MTGINLSSRVRENLSQKHENIKAFLVHFMLFISVLLMHLSDVYKYVGLLFSSNISFHICYSAPNKVISTITMCSQYLHMSNNITLLRTSLSQGSLPIFLYFLYSYHELSLHFPLINIPLSVEIIFTNPQ